MTKRKSEEEVVKVVVGRCHLKPACWICGNDALDWAWPEDDCPAKVGHGYASIDDGETLPLCETCFNRPDVLEAVACEFWGSGYEAKATVVESNEIADAMAEKHGRQVN
jgi:hypothetical protein